MKTFAQLMLLSALAACSSTPAPRAADEANATTAHPLAASKPDQAKVIKHLQEHVKYPASRDAILAACAETPEFSADEKRWIADSLPRGEYKSADDVARA